MAGFFVDVHSHVVPSGDDGAQSIEEGLDLCLAASRAGTRVIFATPHIWPFLPLTPEREAYICAALDVMEPALAEMGLDLRLGFELTPTEELLDEDPRRYRLEGLDAVLMEVPFEGSLRLCKALASHISAAGLRPVIAHPERSERVVRSLDGAVAMKERGWLLQVNGSSLLGRHGPQIQAAGWELVDRGLADLVASDGHRTARAPLLDEAYRAVRARVGERADALFDGRALGFELAARDRVDLAQRS